MIAAAIAHVDAAAEDRPFRQIVLLDGPSVLGWSRWREFQARTWLEAFENQIAGFMRSKVLRELPPKALTQVIVAALNEAVMFVATPDRDAARRDMSPSSASCSKV
jgi:hypothetical protein